MTSITPFGQTRPYAYYKATDMVLMAMGGLMQILGDPDRPPVRVSQPQAFFQGSIHGAVGSLMAHYHRQSTGEGQHVDVSCQEAIEGALAYFTETCDMLKHNTRREGPLQTSARPAPLGTLRRRMVYASAETEDAKEAIQCFLEKRRPVYKRR